MTTENTDPIEEEAAQTAQPEVQPDITASPERTFTQEDVNRLQAQTRRDVRNQFADYQKLKDRAAKADELEQAQLSDQEKLEARVVDAEKRAQDSASQVSAALIASEVKVKASQMGIIDPDAAYLLLNRTNIQYDADNGVSGVDDALTQLLEDKPYLRGTPNRVPNLNPETGQPAPTLRLTADQREAARLMGMSEEEYSLGI